MTVDRDQKYQEKGEAAVNMLCQLKQRYQLNKGHDKIAIPAAEEVHYVSTDPLLEYMSFGADISDRVVKIWVATLLGGIFRLHQHTKNLLKYVHKNSNYGHLVTMPSYDTQDIFQELQETKTGLTKFVFICLVVRRKIRCIWHNTCQSIFLINMKMKQFFATSQCGLSVRTFMKPESVALIN